jgi:glycosyltransferase involved in cell wall biosynthesis
MKVLFGEHVEHYVLGLARELVKRVDLTILCLNRYDVPSKQVVLPNIRKVRGVLRILSLKLLSRLSDIVHINNSLDGLYSGVRDNLIITEHGWPNPKLAPEAPNYYAKERNALINLYETGVPIVTISNYSALMLHKELGVKVRKVIYHGLLDEFRVSNPKELDTKDTPVILWVSRFIHMKEPMVLLEALRNLDGKIDFKVILKGNGPLKNSMEEFIKKHGMTGKTIFIGEIPFKKMPKLYDSATVLVHTSSQEPFGLCVLEGMGMGLPVIVPKSGGAYEIAGSAALSFTPRDPKDLAEKIHLLLSDSELYYKQSEKSLQKSKLFTWERAAKEYCAIYEKYRDSNNF